MKGQQSMGPWWSGLDTPSGFESGASILDSTAGKKEAGETVAVGGMAGLHGGGVTGDRLKWCFGALKLAVRRQGGVGEDGEAGGDVGEALEG
jgi:hypothetical protein